MYADANLSANAIISTSSDDRHGSLTKNNFHEITIDEKIEPILDKRLPRALEYKLEGISRSIYKRSQKLAHKTSQALELIPRNEVHTGAGIQKRLGLLREIDILENEIKRLSMLQDALREEALSFSSLDETSGAGPWNHLTAALWKCAMALQTRKARSKFGRAVR
ncbi:hypothetical protein KEM54_002818 [Ascosphaera aggregata]|nr:hypothetical protein KEM54_002818 [Ascosphaera aggregata]